MKKGLIAAFALFASNLAFAELWRANYGSNEYKEFTTKEAAMSFLASKLNVGSTSGCRLFDDGYTYTCNSSKGGSLSVRKFNDSGCRAGTVENEQKECVPEKKEEENKCTAIAGKVTKLSVPAGWAHLDSTGEVRDFKSSGPAPDQVCKGGCQYLLMSNEVVPGSTVYAPKINNGGYHPVFTQYTYAGTDTQCEADTDLTAPSTPPPPPEKPKEPEKPFTCPTGKCPGVANGQQVCVPCGSTPGQGEGDGDDKGKDKEPGDSSGNNNESDKGDKDGSKDGSSDGKPGANGNGSGNGTGSGTGNGNGTGTGPGSGSGSGGGNGSGNGKGDGKGDKEEGEDGAGPSFGERPGLYEPKYKNGVKGVWDEKSASFKNTQLGQLSKRLLPTVNSGSCPSWTFDLNFGRGLGFGTHRLQPPCTIWPMLRAIVLVCALILARKLVFGG